MKSSKRSNELSIWVLVSPQPVRPPAESRASGIESAFLHFKKKWERKKMGGAKNGGAPPGWKAPPWEISFPKEVF
jgi:hypothetical protein